MRKPKTALTKAGAPRKRKPRKGEGRPSKYDPKFCEDIVAFCAKGFSITGWAGSIGVGRETVTGWANEHPEFSLAVKAAKAAACHAYEQDAARVRKRGGGPGTATLIVFGLKNMGGEDYRDKQEVEHSGAVDVVSIAQERLAKARARKAEILAARERGED